MPRYPEPAVMPLQPPYAPPPELAYEDVRTEETTRRADNDLAVARTWSGSRAGRFVRGRPEDPAWVRPSLLALLVVTCGAGEPEQEPEPTFA